eukprot:TRINITY_DN347_c0_g1_i2.p1 TRINITY_DN347_c0_g1~~TRINITY_DN347_c0_g1_i2.p1  ORF type:complete len:178 (+),score=27.38 TRINITY_DN347_c0_g1_i2:509-1042(+)
MRVGRCGKGSKCCASHSHTMKLSPRYVEHRAAAMSEESPVNSPPPSPPSEPVEAVTCRNWAASGSCQYGDQCFYAHTHVEEHEESFSSSWEESGSWDGQQAQWDASQGQWAETDWAESQNAQQQWDNWGYQQQQVGMNQFAPTQTIPYQMHNQIPMTGMPAGAFWGAQQWAGQQQAY